MNLALVWRQLDLFLPGEIPQRPRSDNPCMSDEQRSLRTGGQWLRAINAYLNWRTGDSWRRPSDPRQRWDPERLEYLDAIRLLNGIGLASVPTLSANEIPVRVFTQTDIEVANLAANSRAWLVCELMRVDPSLCNRKILLHLQRPKLARMLLGARSKASALRIAA